MSASKNLFMATRIEEVRRESVERGSAFEDHNGELQKERQTASRTYTVIGGVKVYETSKKILKKN